MYEDSNVKFYLYYRNNEIKKLSMENSKCKFDKLFIYPWVVHCNISVSFVGGGN